MRRKDFLKSLSIMPFIPIQNLKDLYQTSANMKSTDKMPVLFLGHGSPMNAIEENEFVSGFRDVERTIPTPNAIICVSAHWYTHGTKVTAMTMPRTIHDFGGFPQELYQVMYPAQGDPLLAQEVKDVLQSHTAELDEKWGLDHGAWSVIKHLYPKANIPVIQLSIDYTKPPEYHYELAKQLQVLRQKGILIIGSGNIIHNLRLADFPNINKDNYGYDWAIEARHTINQYLVSGNYAPLLDYQQNSRALQLAIPSPDHFLPLIYTLGLQDKGDELSIFNDKLLAGSLSMTSIKLA